MSEDDTNTKCTPLESMPIEILRLICEELCIHCHDPSACPDGVDYSTQRTGIVTLGRLSETCTTLKGIAQPMMFHRPCLHVHVQTQGAIGSFIRTIQNRPDLRSSVKQICSPIRYYNPSSVTIEDSEYMIQLATEMRLNCEADPNFVFATTHGAGFFSTDLMMALLPDIECLMLDQTYLALFVSQSVRTLERGLGGLPWFASRCEALRNQHADYELPIFPKLRNLSISTTNSTTGQDSGHLGASFFLGCSAPNLEYLSIVGLDYHPDEEANPLEHWRPAKFENLRTIDLQFCGTTGSDEGKKYLVDLFRSAPKLEKIRYSTPYTFCSTVGLLQLLIEAKSTQTLEHLDVAVYRPPPSAEKIFPNDRQHLQILSSLLSQFSKVKTLKLEEQAICEHWQTYSNKNYQIDTCITSKLPNHIKVFILRISWDFKVQGDLVRLGHEVAAGKFPDLECIGLEVMWSKWNTPSVHHLSMKLAELIRALEIAFSGTKVAINIAGRDTTDGWLFSEPGQFDVDELDAPLLGGTPGKAHIKIGSSVGSAMRDLGIPETQIDCPGFFPKDTFGEVYFRDYLQREKKKNSYLN